MSWTPSDRSHGDRGPAGTQACVVVHPEIAGDARARSAEARLEEAVGLARAIDLDVAHAEVVGVAKPKPGTLFGAGTVERLGEVVAGNGEGTPGPTLVVIDAALTPVQQRNLERAWDCKVIDRTGLILEIFGERARTREGVLQVELAALIFARSRLVRSWTHLERQRGGLGFVGGPGETQIETDRRLISERIAKLRRELKDVKRTRELHRAARRRVPYAVIALVGYTNAGKSTLFNRLTAAEVAVQDQLFATLDPTMRRLDMPSGRTAILSDTVGFISDLPHELVEAFHATLEEVTEADIVLHVRDVAHPDTDAQRDDVMQVLAEIGIDGSDNGAPVIEVLNKLDLVDAAEKAAIANRAARSNGTLVPVSAVTGEGCPALMGELDRRLAIGAQVIHVDLAPSDGKTLAWLYDHGEVMEREDTGEAVHLTVRLDREDYARFQRRG